MTGAFRREWGAAAILILAGGIAYHNSLHGPLVFDDLPSIRDNATIRQFSTVLRPPVGMTVDARPVLNASLALNYAWGGLDVVGYHGVNVAIHIAAALVLFGIVRRTMGRLPRREGGLGPSDFGLAVAMLWLVHPLQTESVTYIVQRAESLMGLLYLLTLYFFIRFAGGAQAGYSVVGIGGSSAVASSCVPRWGTSGDSGAGRNIWGWLAVGACALCMATKEVAVTLPVIVLLYDRTFVSGGFREAIRLRGRFHAALAATGIVVILLALSSPGRGGSTGFGSGVAWPAYVAVQFPAMLRYLRLALWPDRLVFDYGPENPPALPVLLISAALVLGGAAAALAGAWRTSPWGFLGVWFFGILAPTSLIPGMLQMTAEHRMYLPLAAVAVSFVAAVDAAAKRMRRRRAGPANAAAAAALLFCTVNRNEIYRTGWALWTDTVAKRPENPYARVNLGIEEFLLGHLAVAAEQFSVAARLRPDYVAARRNLGGTLLRMGRRAEARRELEAAVRLDPANPVAHDDLASLFASEGDWEGAALQLAVALKSKPGDAGEHSRLAEALLRCGRPGPAAAEYGECLRIRPDDPDAHNNRGVALLRMGDRAGARAEFETALRLRPDDADARRNLAGLGS